MVQNHKGEKIVEALKHSIRSLNDLTINPKKVVSHLRRSRKPVLLTKNGKPQVILFDVQKLPKKKSVSELERLIEEAEADVAAGRIEDCDQYIKRLCDAYNLL
jgi:hypothetical protein